MDCALIDLLLFLCLQESSSTVCCKFKLSRDGTQQINNNYAPILNKAPYYYITGMKIVQVELSLSLFVYVAYHDASG